MAVIKLVTTKQALDHLRVEISQVELLDELNQKIAAASAIVMRHIKLTDYDADWYDDESPANLIVPYDVRAATLLIVGELWKNKEASEANVLSQAVADILRGLRTPSMA